MRPLPVRFAPVGEPDGIQADCTGQFPYDPGYQQQNFQPQFSSWEQQNPYAQYPAGQYYSARGPLTADGVPLASWGHRFLATIVDSLIFMVITFVVLIPFWSAIQSGLMAWAADASRSSVPLSFYDAKYGLADLLLWVSIIAGILSLIYTVGLLTSKGATLGQMALGLRVVPAGRGMQHDGIGLGQALVRALVFFVVGYFPLLQFINVLMPLFNAKRQTCHDMIARTQVVKIR